MRDKTQGMTLCALFAALIAVGAFIRVPIPLLPFTLQFLFTNLAGLLLGSRFGSLSVACYLAVGLLGLPVFTGGGGPGYIMQPTFGYLLGFWVGAWACGKVVEKVKTPSFSRYLIAGVVNLTVVYAIGLIYYYVICNFWIGTPIGVGALLLYCFVLAVPGDIALCVLSAGLAKRLSYLRKTEVAV